MLAILLLTACGGGTTADLQSGTLPTPSFEDLQGRYWVAKSITQSGEPRISQRIEFLPNAVRRVILDRDLALPGKELVFPEVQMLCSVGGTGPGFLILNVMGGQDVWKIRVISPDEITIGPTTFQRTDGALPPNCSVQRR